MVERGTPRSDGMLEAFSEIIDFPRYRHGTLAERITTAKIRILCTSSRRDHWLLVEVWG
jgi:hypothetical protein